MTALETEAARHGIKPPSLATLRRYGLTADEWLALIKAQGWRCGVATCGKRGGGVRWNTDHDHIPGWPKLPPEERKKYVRGVLCPWCNHRRVNSRMRAIEAQAIADYLAAYEARRDDAR